MLDQEDDAAVPTVMRSRRSRGVSPLRRSIQKTLGGGKGYELLAVGYFHVSAIPMPTHATAYLRQENQRINAATGVGDGYRRPSLLYL